MLTTALLVYFNVLRLFITTSVERVGTIHLQHQFRSILVYVKTLTMQCPWLESGWGPVLDVMLNLSPLISSLPSMICLKTCFVQFNQKRHQDEQMLYQGLQNP